MVAAITVNHPAAEGSWLELRLPGASRDRVEGSPKCPTHIGLLGARVLVSPLDRPWPLDSGWIVPIGYPDRRCEAGGSRGVDFTHPTPVKGFERPVGPLLSLQVRGCYLQLNTGIGTDGVVVGVGDFELGFLDSCRDSESGIGFGWFAFLGGVVVEVYQWRFCVNEVIDRGGNCLGLFDFESESVVSCHLFHGLTETFGVDVGDEE